jgi:hypothetical protein
VDNIATREQRCGTNQKCQMHVEHIPNESEKLTNLFQMGVKIDELIPYSKISDELIPNGSEN